MVHEESRTRDVLTAIFPECVGKTLTVATVVLYFQFIELCTHVLLVCREYVDTGLLLDFVHVFDDCPLSGEIKRVSTSSECCRAKNIECDFLVQHLGELHTIMIVGVRPIKFHVGEFL